MVYKPVMGNFINGQRWYSEGEPELGLGLVEVIEAKTITLSFPLANEKRTYNAKHSPLKRFSLKAGDEFKTLDGISAIVADVQEMNGVLFYLTDTQGVVPEMHLHPKIDLNSCGDRILAKNFDPPEFFNLRYQSYLAQRKYQELPYKGFIGCSIRLIHHQLYVASKATKTLPVRAMLCDEVGLGKTIESALILNSLAKKELIDRCLIVVPSSLVNQWFVELYKKFYLSFSIWSEDTDFEFSNFLIIGLNELNENIEMFQEELPKYNWQCFIFDESHQNDYKGKLNFLNDLTKNAVAKVLLSATPEVLGEENLFNQLHFLDPDKYQDFERFKKQQTKSFEISELIRANDIDELQDYLGLNIDDLDDAIQTIIDIHGTGRSYYRNARASLHQNLFKERVKNPIAISPEGKLSDKLVFDSKLEHLLAWMKKHPDEKMLIIAHSKALILKIQKNLLELANLKIAVFHSEQSLLERDRQAAYFADDKGAQLLLCTEIGSEGRNFEFCHHLFLFDLPRVPEQLEQRIGRLDRIGQQHPIQIYIPYITKSFEEIIFRYYNDVLEIFDAPSFAVSKFHQNNREKIRELVESKFDQEILNSTIEKMQADYLELKKELALGRNYLVERNSYNHDSADKIVSEITEFESQNPVLPFLQEVCEQVGIRAEDLDAGSVFFEPLDNMYIPSFPGLPQEGISYATNRAKASARDDLHLLNWESPIAQGALDLFLKTPLGNCSFAFVEKVKAPLYLEAIYTLECVDEMKHRSSLFLPLTPIRVLIDVQAKDVTREIPKKLIDQNTLKSAPDFDWGRIPQDILKRLIDASKGQLKARVTKYKTDSLENADKYFQKEMDRLHELKLEKDLLTEHLEELESLREATLSSIGSAKVQMDAARLILKAD